MPFDKYKIRLVNEDGDFLGYRCELCGFEVHVMGGGWLAMTASSAMTNHIKSKHAKEYEEHFGHPPIWRYDKWKNMYDSETGKWIWRRKE